MISRQIGATLSVCNGPVLPAFLLLDFADRLREAGTPIEQREQFAIDSVDLRTQRKQLWIGSGVGFSHGEQQIFACHLARPQPERIFRAWPSMRLRQPASRRPPCA
jgi:hypothetical protein